MSEAALNKEQVLSIFREFQTENPGYEILIVLSAEGILEFSSDEGFCTPEEAKNLLKAWKEHESAVIIGEDRFPILSWEELQFAARNVRGKGVLVGAKTKTNRYVVIKISAETKAAPTIAAIKVNRWSWNLI